MMTTNKRKETVVKTICNMCMNHCGIDAYIEEGKVVKVRGMAEPFIIFVRNRPHTLN